MGDKGEKMKKIKEWLDKPTEYTELDKIVGVFESVLILILFIKVV